MFASTAFTTGTVLRLFSVPFAALNGLGCVVKISFVATTSDVTAFASTVDKSLPTASWSFAVNVKLCWSAVAV